MNDFAHHFLEPRLKSAFPKLLSQQGNTMLETYQTRLEMANVGYRVQLSDGKPTEVTIEIVTQMGHLSFDSHRKTPWMVFPNVEHAEKKVSEERLDKFALFLLSLWNGFHAEIPWHHMPVRALDKLEPGEQNIVRRELPAAFDAPASIQKMFGECVLAMALDIVNVRDRRRRFAERAAQVVRRKKQFDRIPAGTILAHRKRSDLVAIVSDTRGQQTKRSLSLRSIQNREQQQDMMKANRDEYCFITLEKARMLEPELLSRHQLLDGLRQAHELAPNYPDLT